MTLGLPLGATAIAVQLLARRMSSRLGLYVIGVAPRTKAGTYDNTLDLTLASSYNPVFVTDATTVSMSSGTTFCLTVSEPSG